MRSLCALIGLVFVLAGADALAADTAAAPEAKAPVPPHAPSVAEPVPPAAAVPQSAPVKPTVSHPPGANAAAAANPTGAKEAAPAVPPRVVEGAAVADPTTSASAIDERAVEAGSASAERAPAPPPRSRRAPKAERKDPSPRSLTLEALRDEIVNSPAEIEKNNLLKEREHLGELVGALDTAQKQLRRDTERLAAFLEEAKKQSQEKQTEQQESQAALAIKEAEVKAKAPTGPSPLETLAKAMRGMKPAQAAAIAERVPLSLAADVLQKMPARDAGRVMGLMNAERAAALAAEIASRDDAKKRAVR